VCQVDTVLSRQADIATNTKPHDSQSDHAIHGDATVREILPKSTVSKIPGAGQRDADYTEFSTY